MGDKCKPEAEAFRMVAQDIGVTTDACTGADVIAGHFNVPSV